jgi:hypothetical protein
MDMNTEDRILLSARNRKEPVMLRSEFSSLGGRTQVNSALTNLVRQGLLSRAATGVYVRGPIDEIEPRLLEDARKRARSLKGARMHGIGRQGKHLDTAPFIQIPTKGVAAFVTRLAKRMNVRYVPTVADRWAEHVTALAGDRVTRSQVADQLLALFRANAITKRQLNELLVNHLREKKGISSAV